MPSTPTSGTIVSFGNTPQAGDDLFATQVNENTTATVILDVMSNDLGGNAKSLYSLDDATSAGGIRPIDLLGQDAVNAVNYSALGAQIWITSTGKVAYTLTPALQASLQALKTGEYAVDTFTYAIKLGNGTLSWATATVRIAGVNDAASIGGVASGSVTEDATSPNLKACGTLTVTDLDAGEAHFQPQTSYSGAYGTFTLDADGHWTYTANNSSSAIQSLGAGEHLTDSFTAVSQDGTASQLVTVTINGVNDTAVIGGVSIGCVKEDATSPNLTTDGTLTVSDVDAGQAHFQAQAGTPGSNGYGTFTLDADGHWTYSADNSQAAIQHLGAGESLTDSFTAVSQDGSATQTVTVTIKGTNDLATISGDNSGSVTEDASDPTLSTGGTLSVSDVDNGQNHVQASEQDGSYGHFSIDAAGHWTYTASNSQAAVQSLGAGDTITDSFTVLSADGTDSETVTITIHGTNDVPVLGGETSGSVTEDV
ncbi:MAG: adhesin, partial [Elusimicrobia bacterium]|nr:adhesin [Elusimicrobiota bacterium]